MLKIQLFEYKAMEYRCEGCQCMARRIFKVFIADSPVRYCPECFYDEVLYPAEPIEINYSVLNPFVRDNDIAVANNNAEDGIASEIDKVF